MSGEATFWAWSLLIRIPGSRPAPIKLAFLCLADCHNSDNGRCDPSVRYISKFTGLDKKTVTEALGVLTDLGLITPEKRLGTSTHYQFNFERFPIPPREKKKPRPLVIVEGPKQEDLSQERGTPRTGTPSGGVPQERETPLPVNGGGGYPLTGTEPKSNLQSEPTSLPVPIGTAAGAAHPVENFNLMDLGRIYMNPDVETEIYTHGVALFLNHGLDTQKAKNFIRMLINKHGEGAVLDALITTLIEQPFEPKAYMTAVLKKQGSEIPKDWQPPAPCLSELAGMGIPDSVYQSARDVFVIWFREMGIRHTNFPALFVRWCQRDWERAEGDRARYLNRLRACGGFGEEFKEPA